jgi:hypothetical protein
MKSIKTRVFCMAVAWALLCAGIAIPISAQSGPADGLDAAIRAVSDYLNKQLPGGNKLAILNIQSEFPALSEYIIDELIANTVNDRIFSVVDRQQINTIRTELEFQMSGEVNDESAQSIGQMLGAEIIISGAVSRIGGLYRLRVRALSVQSAQIAGQFNQNIPSGPTIAALVQSSATGYGAASIGSGAVQTSAPVQAGPAVTYKVGDTGPAGGLIFYDKGNNSDGWRYMEAAPAITETAAQWRHNSGALSETAAVVGETSREVGMGQTNTQNIMQYFSRNGGGFGLAAQVCNELVVNGFDDWFLPSQDELSYMYGNLYRRGIGGFKNEWYYSSTIVKWTNGSYAPSRINFANGEPDDGESAESRRVRACRQF